MRATSPVPLYFSNGHGARLVDVDGNEYIDYQLAWGPNILGYNRPCMVEAMRVQAGRPYSYGAQHELEITVAECIQGCVPCAERVAFTSSGSEAVQFVQRLARAYTGRPRVLKFEGHYHGWMDSVLLSLHPLPSPASLACLPSCNPAFGRGAEHSSGAKEAYREHAFEGRRAYIYRFIPT